MTNSKHHTCRFIRFLVSVPVGMLFSLALFSCAAHQPEFTISQYRFSLNDQIYRIRSISFVNKSDSYNEVIGETFMALDYDQDGVLDVLVMGEISLQEAQAIYQQGIRDVMRENKLLVKNRDIRVYAMEKNRIKYEIITFGPADASAFNEFKVTDNRPIIKPEQLILIDHNADGILDDVIQGTAALEKYQWIYKQMIETGLQEGTLIEENGTFLVR